DTEVRNLLNISGSSTTISVRDLLEIRFPEIEFPVIEIPDSSMQFDTSSSENESVISSYEEEYNFITKTQPKKGKKSGNGEKRSTPLSIEFIET
ncbi:4668_t:CDS:1, partial [Dentiscutata erythropus]